MNSLSSKLVFTPSECWNFSSGKLDFHKGFLVYERLPNSDVPRPQPWVYRAGSQVLPFPQSVLKSICLLPDPQVSKTPPSFLGVWCYILLLPQKHFGLWMNVSCYRMEVQKQGMSFSIMILISWKGQSPQNIVLGKMIIYMWKNEVRALSSKMYKN